MRIETFLKELGLKDLHAQVYIACLNLGSGSILQIAEKAGVPRSTCEVVLTSLQKRGLVFAFNKKRTKWFGAEDPHRVLELEQRKSKLLEEHLPLLMASYGGSKTKPNVRFYQGTNSMQQVLDEILTEATELLCIASADDLFTTLRTRFPKFADQRASRRIPLRLLLTNSPFARKRAESGPQELRSVRLLPPQTRFHGLTYIWKNKIAFFSLEKDLEVVVIESSTLANMQRQLFELLWNRALLP